MQGQAKGRGSPRFPEELANLHLPGGQADESLQVHPGRKAELRLRQLPVASKRRHSNPAVRQGKLPKCGGGRRSEALGRCSLGVEARRSAQSRRWRSAGCWQKPRRCEFARCWQKTQGQSRRRRRCAWQKLDRVQLAWERPAIQRHPRRTPCDVDGSRCEELRRVGADVPNDAATGIRVWQQAQLVEDGSRGTCSTRSCSWCTMSLESIVRIRPTPN